MGQPEGERKGFAGWVALRQLARFFGDRRAAISPLMTLMLVPLIGVMGLAGEVSGWYYTARSMQNAADSAALAVATTDCATVAACEPQAWAVTARYGFTNGVGDVTVTSTANTVACPAPSVQTNCYQVTVSKAVPFYLVSVVGFVGDTKVGGANGQTLQATAIASPLAVGTDYCIVTLAHGTSSCKSAFTCNGCPNANLGGCDAFSNAQMTCHGNNPGIGQANTVCATPSSCGTSQDPGLSAMPDPFSSLASNIPTSGCTAITSPITTANWSSSACVVVSGTLKLNGNVSVTTASPGTVLVINNGGSLNLNGYNLTAPVGSGLTIVFTGSSGAPGFVTGSGTLDFGAPTSGVWSGVAMYQDPALTTTSSPTYSGNSPTFNITGLLYLPYASLTIKGAINHQTGGNACMAVVADQLTISGTGSFFANPTSQCRQAGLTLPTVPGAGNARPALVW